MCARLRPRLGRTVTSRSEEARLGSWTAWAGDRSRWPVSPVGALAVDWAVDVHRRFFGDDLLMRALRDRPPHPFVAHWRWPLTSPHAVVELLNRACALTVVPIDVGTVLARSTNSGAVNIRLSSDLYVLEVAGFATRYGWNVQREPSLPSGRRPDLRLLREGEELWVEVTGTGPDRPRLSVEAWSQSVVPALMAIGSRHDVEISGSASSTQLDGDELQAFLAAVEVAAVDTASSGEQHLIAAIDVSVSIRSGGSGIGTFEGPPLRGDMWPKLERRLLEKATQTEGASAAWICVQDRSGLFQLTDLATVDEREQLRRLAHNVSIALADSPHIAGVVLSTGVRVDAGEEDHDTVLGDEGADSTPGSVVLRRRLPGGRCRRTFVVRLDGEAGVEPGPTTWFEQEASWLNWALVRAGQPEIESILDGAR